MKHYVATIFVLAAAGCSNSTGQGTTFATAAVDDTRVERGSIQETFQLVDDAGTLRFVTQGATIASEVPDGFQDGSLAKTNAQINALSEVRIEVRSDGSDGYIFDVTANGETRSYFDGDGSVSSLSTDRFYIYTPAFESYLSSIDGDWKDVLAGEGTYTYLARFRQGVTTFGPELTDTFVTSVFGIPTTDVPTTGSVRYVGNANGLIDYVEDVGVDPDEPVVGGQDRFIISMDVELDVAFKDQKVSGGLDNITVDGDAVAGAFAVEEANMRNGSFEAAVVADPMGCAANCLALDSGTLSGGFFGPNAEEAGGVLALEGSAADGNPFVATSAWAGAKDE